VAFYTTLPKKKGVGLPQETGGHRVMQTGIQNELLRDSAVWSYVGYLASLGLCFHGDSGSSQEHSKDECQALAAQNLPFRNLTETVEFA
jgi:hypothetical protein